MGRVDGYVTLVFPRVSLQIRASGVSVTSIVLTKPNAVRRLIVLLRRRVPPLQILPGPTYGNVLSNLLLLLNGRHLLLIRSAPLFAVLLGNVVGTTIPRVRNILRGLMNINPINTMNFNKRSVVRSNNEFITSTPFKHG